MQGYVPILAVAWWAPLAIVGGALVGAGLGYLLLAWAGSGESTEARAQPQQSQGAGAPSYERAKSTTDVRWNPWAFVVAGAIVALIVGLSIGLSAG